MCEPRLNECVETVLSSELRTAGADVAGRGLRLRPSVFVRGRA